METLKSARGFTLIELLIVVLLIGIIAAMATPGLLRARMAANESSAISSLRSVHSAQAAYAATCAAGGYAQSLDDLALVPPGSPHGFTAPPLAQNGAISSGYFAALMAEAGASVIMPAGSTCNGSTAPAMSAYVAERHPVSVGTSGQRSFAITRAGSLYFRVDGVAITSDLSGATVLP